MRVCLFRRIRFLCACIHGVTSFYVVCVFVVLGFAFCSERRRQNSGCWGGCKSHRRKVNYLRRNNEIDWLGWVC